MCVLLFCRWLWETGKPFDAVCFYPKITEDGRTHPRLFVDSPQKALEDELIKELIIVFPGAHFWHHIICAEDLSITTEAGPTRVFVQVSM